MVSRYAIYRKGYTTDPSYEMCLAQLQFWVDVGTMDGCGIGRMVTVEESHPFPSRELAEKWFADNGWTYSARLLRATKEDHPLRVANLREVKEFRFEKWIKQ